MRLTYKGVEIIIRKKNGVFKFESAGISSLLRVKTDCETIGIRDLFKMVDRSEEACAEGFSEWIESEAMPKFDAYLVDEGGEEELHRRVVEYIRMEHGIEYLIPGMGELQDNKRKGRKAYYMGYKGGQPDLMIPIPTQSREYIGFAFEFKTPKGKGRFSKEQKKYLDFLSGVGWKTLKSKNFEEICTAIDEYLDEKKPSWA